MALNESTCDCWRFLKSRELSVHFHTLPVGQ
jgi:hypothetical protein